MAFIPWKNSNEPGYGNRKKRLAAPPFSWRFQHPLGPADRTDPISQLSLDPSCFGNKEFSAGIELPLPPQESRRFS